MDSWVVYVVVGIVVLAVLYFALSRKKELPPAPEKPKEITSAEAAKKAAEQTKSLAPGQPKTSPSKPPPPSAAKKAQPEALPSSDLLPASEHAPAAPPPKPLSREHVEGIRKGLAATRGGFIARLTALFTGKKEIDPAILEQVEEVMIASDVGVKTTQAILGRIRDRLQKNELADTEAVWNAIRGEASRILSVGGGALKTQAKPTVVLMVGVNGVGKTTSIGKLATRYTNDGKKVLLAAGDTFRAAAVQQLEVWGRRVGVEVVKGKEGADPGAVAFSAVNKAKEAGADLLFVDTAGRLHTKTPLMDEIKKVRKTIGKAVAGEAADAAAQAAAGPHETLLVLDATTGQNALTQAAMFKDAVDLTGIILTKLDGTAKGGIVLAICDELKVPVRYIGLGERAEDLREFDADEFVEALFGREDAAAAA